MYRGRRFAVGLHYPFYTYKNHELVICLNNKISIGIIGDKGLDLQIFGFGFDVAWYQKQ